MCNLHSAKHASNLRNQPLPDHLPRGSKSPGILLGPGWTGEGSNKGLGIALIGPGPCFSTPHPATDVFRLGSMGSQNEVSLQVMLTLGGGLQLLEIEKRWDDPKVWQLDSEEQLLIDVENEFDETEWEW